MPTYWQVTKLRGEQSFAVWNLNATFTVGGKQRADLGTLLGDYISFADLLASQETVASQATTAKKGWMEIAELCCIKGAGKLAAELDDDDALDIALGQKVFSIDPKSEAALMERARAFKPIWETYNTRLAGVPGSTPFTIRGKTLANFGTALAGYETAVDDENTAGTDLSGARTAMEQHNRSVDRLIKKWYAAWKNEYPEGTAEGDALLSQVEAEQGAQRPTKLEIDALTNVAGHKVGVTFVAGGGAHATLRFLQIKVVGVTTEFGTVRELSPAEVLAGVEIGPFAAGQQVLVRTDVGNSRDASEISAVQSIVVA